MTKILKKALRDIREGAKAQHEVDAANFAAAKAESKAQWEEAKAFPKVMEEKRREERKQQLEDAKTRMEAAQERIDSAKRMAAETASEDETKNETEMEA